MVRLNGGQSHPKSGPRGPGRAHRRPELRALIFGSAMPPRESSHVSRRLTPRTAAPDPPPTLPVCLTCRFGTPAPCPAVGVEHWDRQRALALLRRLHMGNIIVEHLAIAIQPPDR